MQKYIGNITAPESSAISPKRNISLKQNSNNEVYQDPKRDTSSAVLTTKLLSISFETPDSFSAFSSFTIYVRATSITIVQ